MMSKVDKDFAVCRGVKQEESTRSFEGASSKVGFRVDQSIYLTGFSFYPPIYNGEGKPGEAFLYRDPFSAMFRINVTKLCPPKTSKCGTVTIPRNFQILNEFTARLNKEDILGLELVRVNPPQMIKIEANSWHDISFVIDGPNSVHLDFNRKGSINMVVTPGEGETGKIPITFDFLHGSGQLPQLHFLLG